MDDLLVFLRARLDDEEQRLRRANERERQELADAFRSQDYVPLREFRGVGMVVLLEDEQRHEMWDGSDWIEVDANDLPQTCYTP